MMYRLAYIVLRVGVTIGPLRVSAATFTRDDDGPHYRWRAEPNDAYPLVLDVQPLPSDMLCIYSRPDPDRA